MGTYDTRKIREFLENYFSDDELTALCYDYFRKVHDAFGSAWSKPQKVQQLIGYCSNHTQFEKLMQLLQEERPAAFRLHFSEEKVEIKFLLPSVRLDKLLSEQVNDLTEGYRHALASILGVPVDNLEIVGIAPSNSAIVSIRLPLSDSINAVLITPDQKRTLGLDPDSELTQESLMEFLRHLKIDSTEQQAFLRLLRSKEEETLQKVPSRNVPTIVKRQPGRPGPITGRRTPSRSPFIYAKPQPNQLIQARKRLEAARTELAEAQQQLAEERSELVRLLRQERLSMRQPKRPKGRAK